MDYNDKKEERADFKGLYFALTQLEPMAINIAKINNSGKKLRDDNIKRAEFILERCEAAIRTIKMFSDEFTKENRSELEEIEQRYGEMMSYVSIALENSKKVEQKLDEDYEIEGDRINRDDDEPEL